MTYLFLKELENILQREVCEKHKYKRPVEDDSTGFMLATPEVYIGWTPVSETGSEMKKRVPAIVIGLGGAVADDGEYITIPVQLVLIVHSAGTVVKAEDENTLHVDNTGYVDLLNFIDATARAVRNLQGTKLTLADETIRYSTNNEQYYDYWLGNIDFTLRAKSGTRSHEKDLYL